MSSTPSTEIVLKSSIRPSCYETKNEVTVRLKLRTLTAKVQRDQRFVSTLVKENKSNREQCANEQRLLSGDIGTCVFTRVILISFLLDLKSTSILSHYWRSHE